MEKIKSLFKNKKFVRIFYAVLVLIIVLSIFLYFRLSKEKTKIKLADVKVGNISENYETSATIESGGQISYTILNGTKATKLNVKVGDSVKKGDLLATFDTSGVIPLIDQKQKEYNEANLKYKNAVATINKANYETAELNKKIHDLESLAQTLRGKPTKENAGDGQQAMSVEELRAILDAIGGAGSVLSEAQLNSLYKEIESNGGTVFSDYSEKDIQKIISSGSSTETQLLGIQLQISMLNSQKEMLNTNNSQTILDTYQSIEESAKASLDDINKQKQLLDKGWVAQTDGVITELNIVEGEPYSQANGADADKSDLLSIIEGLSSKNIDINSLSDQIKVSQNISTGTGLVQDSYTDYCATFKLGKYDSQKIRVNMPVKISFLTKKYDGYVSYVSAKAQNSTSGISAITGAGSSSSNKLIAKVAIKNPDKNLVVGFDAKISIKTNQKKGVILIP
ncbi:MAG: biotin/lipoyl-binding protein, partial [Oscillospiraceae bacterium]